MSNRDPATLRQLRALVEFWRGATYSDVGGGERQAGYQILRRLEQSLFGGESMQGKDKRCPPRVIASGGTSLTPLGEELARHAALIVEHLDSFARAAEAARGNTLVRVLSVPAAVPIVDLATERCASREASLIVEVEEIANSERGRWPADVEGADVVLMPGSFRATPPEWKSELLYEWPLRVVMKEDLGGMSKDSVELHELAERRMPLLASPRGHESRELLEDALGRQRVPDGLRVTFESSSPDLLVQRAEKGLGIAVLPGDCTPVQNHLRAGKRAPELSVEGTSIVGAIHLYSLRSRTHQDEFLMALREAADDRKMFGTWA